MSLGTMLVILIVPFGLLTVLLLGAWKSGPLNTKRTVVYCAYLVGGGLIFGALLYYQTVQPVSFDEKRDPSTQSKWGYSLERYTFRDRFRLKLWNDQRISEMRFSYEGPAHWKMPVVVEQRWLSGDRAIYLNLELGFENSLPESRTPTKIIYDFDRGQLYLFGQYWLWRRHPERHNSRERWMTEQEFQEVMRSLER